VLRTLRVWLPEALIIALTLFFAVRELSVFPAPWADEGLFIIVAKMMTWGQGYALPLLDTNWHYPYFLNVGPTLIAPVALSLKLFGGSIAVARLPMVLWICVSVLLTYIFTKKLLGRTHALYASALLITLSAFVNTGKPVLGEIPAYVFLIAGFLTLEYAKGWKRTLWTGFLFGLCFLTKITFGLILPALGLAWLWAAWKRDWKEVQSLSLIGILTVIVYLPWRILEMSSTLGGSLSDELQNFLLGKGGDSTFMYVLRENRELLLRLPFVAFGIILILGLTGLWMYRKQMSSTLWIFISALIILFILYFLNGFGWYRLLLPGHLLLLPFVPLGAWSIFGKRTGSMILIAIIAVQAWWQLDHRGSGIGTTGDEAAAIIQEEYADTDLVIEQTEIFARLPQNPKWHFLMPGLSFSIPSEFVTLHDEYCLMPLLIKESKERLDEYGDRAKRIAGSYFVLLPPHCTP
jgi:4-amino-4-deoxy-L-arabinose transferase-like glycosyltransferase